MGRSADRLPIYNLGGFDPAFELSDGQFKSLASQLGVAEFADTARADLLLICKTYLTFRHAELGAEKHEDAAKIWTELRETAMRFIAVGEGSSPPNTGAGVLVEQAFFDGMAPFLIQLTERDIEPAELDLALSKGDIPVKGLNLRLSRSFMMRVATVFRQAIDHADQEIANMGPGFRPGQAFTSWLLDVREWANQNGYAHGADATGASRFAVFLFHLHGFMPRDLREQQMASAEAMNARLRRAVRMVGANTSAD
ncbi:hypothetical protein BFX40_23700 [Mesorhizobium sp. SEMIA 3007]|uniref:hypothetical protein n=1 Tax=Mesorhizobium sp. SEMIA 3007 TaxID=1862350 RepID=UPI00083CC0E9|nr:hypothetical protein [Mesorhizobium sp. SEMIA 3007]ODA95567.1 hypothetical protein BFX40_23700 [Mesorhizobium sp. SEMIA 3007]